MHYRAFRILLATITALCTLLFGALLVFVPILYPRATSLLLLLAIPCAILAFVGALLLSGILLAPLTRLVEKVRQFASGDLSIRFAEDSGALVPFSVRELTSSLDRVSVRVRSTVAEVAAESKRQRQFISDVSHEIRTPLTSIRGAAETLMDEDISYEDRTRFCQTIVRESERLTRLANDLLTLQRIEGEGEIKLKRVNLHTIVAHATDMLEPLLEERIVRLTVSGEAPDVLGDSDRLQQVVQNLVENASRFVGEGGRVHVELSGIRGHSVITVSDDGPGFGDVDPARLFDRFYRGDPSRARTTGSTGLGLTIVKAIVTAHEGTVEALNLPGGGACFLVAIPSLPPKEK
ncbi:MAG: HAMP domain-containing histidine kinase [Coriobacteriales bacterium]|jgi:two-component system OmpR family sensor kinase|nr:HAMP domain-containing histidine kinase [Coriobacteriales bacterium]